MKRRPRKLYASLAIAAGLVLGFLEAKGLMRGESSGGCFWLVVAGLMVALGVAELVSGRGEPKE